MKILKARALMALNPGFLMAGNVATRLDGSIESENGVSLGQLFFFNKTLSRHILLNTQWERQGWKACCLLLNSFERINNVLRRWIMTVVRVIALSESVFKLCNLFLDVTGKAVNLC